MKPFVPFVALVLLAGCATKVWYQPGKTEAELRKDWAESQIAARQAELRIRYPIVLQPDIAASMAHKDARNAARDIAPLTMQSRGYQLVPLSTLPTNAVYLRP